ncbi:hypothetical protein TNCV_4518461 [Trichonephila clavipes]|nr:hypothetical protein TNCV_4518461 [Trichonephila clavipes]
MTNSQKGRHIGRLDLQNRATPSRTINRNTGMFEAQRKFLHWCGTSARQPLLRITLAMHHRRTSNSDASNVNAGYRNGTKSLFQSSPSFACIILMALCVSRSSK